MSNRSQKRRPEECGADDIAIDRNPILGAASFQMDPQYDWDLHRADMAWALHVASRGLSEQQIRDEILHAGTYQIKADLSASSITRDGPRSRGSARSSRSAERAAPLWTARRRHIVARRRSACRSHSAALDSVRRCFTASAPDTVMSSKPWTRLARRRSQTITM